MRAAPEAGSETKWKVVGDKALAAWQLDLAQEAFEKSKDLPALLLLYTSLSDRNGLERLAQAAVAKGQNNIAFAAYLQLGDSASCIELLASTDRLPEAALMARSYNPSLAPGIVKKWKAELETQGKPKVAAVIGNPEEDRDLFEEAAPVSAKLDSEGSGVMVEKEGVDGLTEQVQDLSVGEQAAAPSSPEKAASPEAPAAAAMDVDEAEEEEEEPTPADDKLDKKD